MKQLPAAIGCVHTPALQIAFSHATPLLVHVAPFGFSVIVQPPLPLHEELDWQSVGVHVYAVPPHAPLVHWSIDVQALPSSQLVVLPTLDQDVALDEAAHH
jgi:hypothetical protein